ncbi:transporter [Acetomicrobium hydrogeniformans]|uniref:transporter n=1 Tax=Acetomicrobium hydrogeniformans TaxID=649746 RepID=UPI0009FA70DE
MDGVGVPDSREKVFGIGPGIMYGDRSSTYIVNYYFEDDAENRPEGDRLVFRYMSSF